MTILDTLTSRKPASPQPAQPRDGFSHLARRGALFLAALYLTHLAFAVPEMAAYARGCVEVERCAGANSFGN